jgi:di/tripeptidase
MSSSDSALREACLARFLHYVTFDTQSDENSETYPSTFKQLDLLRALDTSPSSRRIACRT